MARLGFGGYETQHAVADGLSVARVTNSDNIDTSVTHSGGAAARLHSNAAATGSCRHRFDVGAGATGVTYYARVWLRVSTLPDAARSILAATRQASAGNGIELSLHPDGTVRQNKIATATTSSDTLVGTITVNTWYCLELNVTPNGSTWAGQGRLDGVASGVNTTTSALTQTDVRFSWGLIANGIGSQTWSTSATDLYFDDWIVNDSTGSSHTSWPGTLEALILLLPSADSAVSSNWKLGTGTAAGGNAHSSVDNTPPTGKASPADGDQIRNTTNDVTSPNADADFTMQTYAAAGLASGDTVASVRAIAAVAPGTAATQNVGIAGVSNPAVTEVVGATDTSSAGTFPTNWQAVATACLTPGSEPTHGTAPVVRVGRRSATANAVYVAFVGLYVAYTPAPTVGALSGSSALTLTASGTARPIGRVAGTSALALAASATIAARGVLSGSAALVLDADGELRAGNATDIDGSSALTLSASAALKGIAYLTGEVALTLDAEGSLSFELPTRVSEDFTERWASGRHVGEAAPGQRVMVRTGRFNRRHAAWPDPQIDVFIIPASEFDDEPWQAFWEPFTDYVEIPNVREVRLEKSTSNRGLTTATIVVDNIFYRSEEAGHHSIKRGYLAPLRGFVGPDREQLVDEQGEDVEANEWFGLLSRQAQVTVWQSYGDEEVKTFTGLIDDVDATSRPDVITLTLRCFGQVLADERIFGWNKEPAIKDPITFADRDTADPVTTGGYDPDSSTAASDHAAELVLDGDGDTSWRSAAHSTAANTEWVQIRLPEGRYSDYYLNPEFDGMDVWVSLQAKDLANGDPPTRNGEEITPNVWQGDGSGDDVPGTAGGIPFIVDLTDVSAKGVVRSLSDEYILGADSILRISFRSLHQSGDDYFAGVTSLRARTRRKSLLPFSYNYVLIDDRTDIVKQLLRWAGFKEWEVESSGVSLKKPFVANRGMSYLDIIDKIAETIGYTFFIGDPSTADDSIGVPVFRKTRAVDPDATPVATIRDSDLLTAIDVKQSDESLAYIIRVRGRGTSKGETLGGSDTRRVMFTFRPPWAHQLGDPLADDRMGGVIKHVIHTNHLFRDAEDVKFGAYYIALQEALASVLASIEFPAWPGVDLDDHLELLDLATGVTSRLLVTDRSSTFTRTGQGTRWTMTVSGALVDTEDVAAMVEIINTFRRS